jgi:hypothetical protein
MKSTKVTGAALLLFTSLLGVARTQSDTSMEGTIHPRRSDGS